MPTKFQDFTKLPPELRSMIWMHAMPEPRVFEILDTPQSNSKTPAEYGLTFANSCNEPPPALAAACKESRAIVLRSYKQVTLSRTTKYIDPSRDIILLEPYLLIRRLLRALHFLAQISILKDRISQIALGTSYGFSTGISHPVISGKVSKNNMKMLLGKLSRFPRLEKVLFIIHEEFQFTTPKATLPGWNYGLQHFHHSYSRKLEGEVSSSSSLHDRWSFHQNELQFYPLKVEDAKDDDVEEFGEEEEEEEQDRLPTNEDWRRFRRRFLRAVYLSGEKKTRPEVVRLKVEGANLLWRYRSY
jgi:hypothetical protein